MLRDSSALWLIFLASLLMANADDLGAESLIEELAANEAQVRQYEVETKDGSKYNETVVVDREGLKKLIVSTKNGKDEQILYEDCAKNIEYIVNALDPKTCLVHKMTEDERVRMCVEKTRITYKTSDKTAAKMTDKEIAEGVITDSYKMDAKPQNQAEKPSLCENRKMVNLEPEIIGKAGTLEKSEPDTKDSRIRRLLKNCYCCSNEEVYNSYCCRYCVQEGWWGYRRTYCCGGNCVKKSTVRRCKYKEIYTSDNRCHC